MITFEEARKVVEEQLSRDEQEMNNFGSALPGYEERPKERLVITETSEYDLFWVFFYSTKEYVESGDISHALAGNAPYVIAKHDGKLYHTGTAYRLEYFLDLIRHEIAESNPKDGE